MQNSIENFNKVDIEVENFANILKKCKDFFPLNELFKKIDDENLKAYAINKDDRLQRKRKTSS